MDIPQTKNGIGQVVDTSNLLKKVFDDESMLQEIPSQRILSRSNSGCPFGRVQYPVGSIALAIRLSAVSPTSAQQKEYYSPRSVLSQQVLNNEQTMGTEKVTTMQSEPQSKEVPTSEQVEEFISRVPDLSFMLSSSLSVKK